MICLQTLKVKCVPFFAISSQTHLIHFPKKKKRSTTLPQILKENPRVIRATSASFASTLHYWESIIVTEVAICHGVCIPRRQRSEGLGKERCSTVQTVPCYVWCCCLSFFFFSFFFLFRVCVHVALWCLGVCVYWWFGVSADEWIWCAPFLDISAGYTYADLHVCTHLYVCMWELRWEEPVCSSSWGPI